jgi:hypothetical protein
MRKWPVKESTAELKKVQAGLVTTTSVYYT